MNEKSNGVQYQVLVEHDPETGAYTATTPGLPVIVDARSRKEALKWIKEGIALYLEETKGRRRSPNADRPAKAEPVTVEV